MIMKNLIFKLIKFLITLLDSKQIKEISDGYHSYRELYNYRKIYNALLFNEWSRLNLYDVHKSLCHNDGEKCFGGTHFIVVAMLPTGQITNHYKIEDWNLFSIPSKNKALYSYDYHTPNDVLNRMKKLNNGIFLANNHFITKLIKDSNFYAHKKTSNVYSKVTNCSVKQDGKWVDMVLYTTIARNGYFARKEEEFNKSFENIGSIYL